MPRANHTSACAAQQVCFFFLPKLTAAEQELHNFEHARVLGRTRLAAAAAEILAEREAERCRERIRVTLQRRQLRAERGVREVAHEFRLRRELREHVGAEGARVAGKAGEAAAREAAGEAAVRARLTRGSARGGRGARVSRLREARLERVGRVHRHALLVRCDGLVEPIQRVQRRALAPERLAPRGF